MIKKYLTRFKNKGEKDYKDSVQVTFSETKPLVTEVILVDIDIRSHIETLLQIVTEYKMDNYTMDKCVDKCSFISFKIHLSSATDNRVAKLFKIVHTYSHNCELNMDDNYIVVDTTLSLARSFINHLYTTEEAIYKPIIYFIDELLINIKKNEFDFSAFTKSNYPDIIEVTEHIKIFNYHSIINSQGHNCYLMCKISNSLLFNVIRSIYKMGCEKHEMWILDEKFMIMVFTKVNVSDLVDLFSNYKSLFNKISLEIYDINQKHLELLEGKKNEVVAEETEED